MKTVDEAEHEQGSVSIAEYPSVRPRYFVARLPFPMIIWLVQN